MRQHAEFKSDHAVSGRNIAQGKGRVRTLCNAYLSLPEHILRRYYIPLSSDQRLVQKTKRL